MLVESKPNLEGRIPFKPPIIAITTGLLPLAQSKAVSKGKGPLRSTGTRVNQNFRPRTKFMLKSKVKAPWVSALGSSVLLGPSGGIIFIMWTCIVISLLFWAHNGLGQF